MRMMMRVTFPVDTGNAAIANGTFGSTIQKYMAELKPEAAYFVAENGTRTAYFFVNMTESSQLPAMCEPAFLTFDAEVEITPAMNLDDLKAAMPGMEAAVKNFAPSK
jgi:hypothetical protein